MRYTLLAVAFVGTAITLPMTGVVSANGDTQIAQYQSLAQQESAPPEREDAGEPSPRPGADAKPIPPVRAGVEPKSQTGQCAWIGKRTIRVLLRDDLIAADGFMRFYETFACPVRHLGDALGCSLGLADDASADVIDRRVDRCWANPEGDDAPATAVPPAAPPTSDQAPVPKPDSDAGR